MKKNVEIKAGLSKFDFGRILEIAGDIATEPPSVLIQTDTFFDVPRDRLKLREFSDGTAELIAYSRSDQSTAKLSNYVRTPTDHADLLKRSLEFTVGIRGIVKKRRDLFICEQTRIHLDQVEQLGTFLELEVVLGSNQTSGEGAQIAASLMARLGVKSDWLISGAYIDLLEADSQGVAV